jgi:REP element-mobilizing transposase RayT
MTRRFAHRRLRPFGKQLGSCAATPCPLSSPNLPHHIVQRGVRRMDVFFTNEDRMEYLKHLAEQGERFGVSFLAWCLMSNHVHLVAIPRQETSLTLGIGEAHRRYTRYINSREEPLTSCVQQLASNSAF